MGKKTDYAALRAGFGLARGLSDEFIQACERVNSPIEAIHRLVTPQGHGTMDELVRRAVADWQAEQPAEPEVGQPQGGHPYRDAPRNGLMLPANHYRLHVTYAPMPSLATLEQEFGKNNVSDIFDGRAWKLHSSCVGMNRKHGDRVFYLHDVGRDWTGEEQIAWGLQQRNAVAPNGYRSTTHEETYEFSKAHPELVKYVGLGSSTLDDGGEFVAAVGSYGGQRILYGHWLGRRFAARSRVLFVSK